MCPTIEIPGLPSTTTVADTDLLHIRQGDIDKKITGESFKDAILPGNSTTTERGIIELATQTEVNTGTDNERAVTPLTLQNKLDAAISSSGAPNATTTNRGLIEIATTAEGQAGTDTERAVTPQVMKDSVTTHVSQATTVLAGKARIATQTEANTGTDNNTIVTPLTLKNAPGVSVPDASTTVAGKIEIATQGEVNLGSSDVLAVTPATLANSTWVNIPSATTTVQGKVELADLSETQVGTDQTRAVTPYGLKNALPSLIPNASETNRGIIEVATLSEVNAGVDTERAVTPYTLAQSLSGSTVPLASETVAGRIEIATTAEAQGGSDDSRAITPLKLKNSVMTHVLAADGAGSGLDADTLDGVQGSGYALASHEHPWPTSISFSTSTGVLTLNRQTGGSLTVDLDGKYVEAAVTNAAWTYNQTGPGNNVGAYVITSNNPVTGGRVLSLVNNSTFSFTHGVTGQSVSAEGKGVIGYAQGSGDSSGVTGYWGGVNNTVSAGHLGQQLYSVRGYTTPIRAEAGYSPFTGVHISITPAANGRFFTEGDIVEVEDNILFNVNDSVPVIKLTKDPRNKRAIGVVKSYNRMSVEEAFSGYPEMVKAKASDIEAVDEYSEFGLNLLSAYGKHKVCEINSVGEGGINVCEENGDIEIGDYLCSSSVSGKAMKQEDDILHNYTVAKSMQNVKWEEEVPGKTCRIKNGIKWKMVGCTYHCG